MSEPQAAKYKRRMIVAMSKDGVIAVDGKIPWYCKKDLQRFRRLTLGSTVIMGHNTYWSMKGIAPLIGRRNIVISDQWWRYHIASSFHTLDEAVKACEKRGWDYWIIGGAKTYEEGFKHIDYLDITIIPNRYSHLSGDWRKVTKFPPRKLLPKSVIIRRTYMKRDEVCPS